MMMRSTLILSKHSETWCKYQLDKIQKISKYKKSINIPKAVSELIKLIFSWKDLVADNLLNRGSDGETQNAKESLNNIVWTRAPKNVYVGKTVIEIAVTSAVLSFNDGGKGILAVLMYLGLKAGYFIFGLTHKNETRIKKTNIKAGDTGKNRIKKLRATRKGYEDKDKDLEGDVYGLF